MTNKLKILEICPFSAGIGGVWQRVQQEADLLSKNHEVKVFSSDIVKGKNELAPGTGWYGKVFIQRFPHKKSFISKNVNIFNFKLELLNYNPDIVITHLLHPHSFKALEACQEQNIPCYLVTHSPFDVKRPFPLKMATSIFYKAKVKPEINQFTKIITITKWELPHLKKLGVSEDKLVYIPNGIPQEFFTQPFSKPTKDVLFLGRIAPVKNLETLLESASNLPKINFTIVGSAEPKYLEKLNKIIKKHNLSNVKILPPIYDMKKKIQLIDNHKIFVLPSNREAMPQALIEAMSRGKIIIASKTDGAKEILEDNKTGFLFDINNSKQLSSLIQQNLKTPLSIQNNAKLRSKEFAWSKLIKKYEELF